MKRWAIGGGLVLLLGIFGQPAGAQSRPLVTEDPETVPAGSILVEAGVDYLRDASFPAAGLRGNLSRFGTFGFSIGVSSLAEIQVDGGVRNRLSVRNANPAAPLAFMLSPGVAPGLSTGDVEDLVFGAKIRFATETASRPAMALRFSTRLPNAGNESGLGLDTTDFHIGLAMGKTVESVRFVGNLGVGILADPVRGDRQNDVLNYGMSMARAIRTGVEVVGEVNGRLSTRSGTPPPGTESRSMFRIGSRLTKGPVRIDGGILLGITDDDPLWGVTIGGTWVFKAFTVR